MQHFTQGAGAHRSRMRRTEHGDELVDEAEIVLGENAEGVADLIIDAALGKIEIDVPGFFFRPRPVEQTATEKFRDRRLLAASAEASRIDDRGCRRCSIHSRPGSRFGGQRRREETREPGALLCTEWGVLRNQEGNRRLLNAHAGTRSGANSSAIRFNSSISSRLAKT